MGSDNIHRSSEDKWNQEVALAKQAIDEAISKMSDGLQAEACRIGYQFLKTTDDPRSPDDLGDYCRSAQQIRLFLSAIRKQCIEDGDDFAKEVVITYLHELGHHLGMEESHLETWGL
jgi:hypothetical protein